MKMVRDRIFFTNSAQGLFQQYRPTANLQKWCRCRKPEAMTGVAIVIPMLNEAAGLPRSFRARKRFAFEISLCGLIEATDGSGR
jgi:hypothetical protein